MRPEYRRPQSPAICHSVSAVRRALPPLWAFCRCKVPRRTPHGTEGSSRVLVDENNPFVELLPPLTCRSIIRDGPRQAEGERGVSPVPLFSEVSSPLGDDNTSSKTLPTLITCRPLISGGLASSVRMKVDSSAPIPTGPFVSPADSNGLRRRCCR